MTNIERHNRTTFKIMVKFTPVNLHIMAGYTSIAHQRCRLLFLFTAKLDAILQTTQHLLSEANLFERCISSIWRKYFFLCAWIAFFWAAFYTFMLNLCLRGIIFRLKGNKRETRRKLSNYPLTQYLPSKMTLTARIEAAFNLNSSNH